ncbi:HNH endonuclease [Escherichia coli]|uniref:HNH endonuclease signature motif containing protein n=1 Tax=Escherichia coli TaxID=562 RepID=UPI000542513E|nr:HNH endonuclease signature motif containing protein [Escherichia coli]EBW5988281.1 HNH endonuclease [Salmonella enterica subsp. enterica serovar Hull]HBM0002900.1 HNH endonuclease [Salmonella enterica subsp. enterica serovar Gozo]EBY7472165.1 HNH endonuclease [Salmonella enterica subsp. enterica serovar Hull]ECD6252543.1 HNH endonuclease [Salmonella enterica subsp. enterica serovar Hull]EEU9471656.1 HNH endonuclease [Escherichia coli]
MKASELFRYEDGLLFWRIKPARWMRAGDKAGGKTKSGHCIVSINGKREYVHRVVWEIHHGEIPEGMVIDHINGNPSDNRIENLRCVSQQINLLNKRKQKNNTSGITGVGFHKQRGKWRATFMNEYLGSFGSFVDACEARIVAEVSSGISTERNGK